MRLENKWSDSKCNKISISKANVARKAYSLEARWFDLTWVKFESNSFHYVHLRLQIWSYHRSFFILHQQKKLILWIVLNMRGQYLCFYFNCGRMKRHSRRDGAMRIWLVNSVGCLIPTSDIRQFSAEVNVVTYEWAFIHYLKSVADFPIW